MPNKGGYVLTLTTDQVGEVLRDYGRRAVVQRTGFVMVSFVGEPGKELAKLVSVFPEGKTGWNVYPSGQVGGSRFDVTDEKILEEIDEAVYCGPAKPS
jgi:hypothetical protein